ncbi:DUF4920 domain-containing protein [Salinimicrobium sp. CAU 1759]
MKNFNFLLLLSFIMISFTGYSQEKNADESEPYFSVGEEVDVQNVLSGYQMQQRYENLKVGDTLNVTFKADVASVCKKKGCWMNVGLQDGREVMVKFKDYAFFVPKDIEDKEVIMGGKAYVTEMSVEDQRHYAEDAGKTAAEIKAITKPSITLSFIADGVKIKK